MSYINLPPHLCHPVLFTRFLSQRELASQSHFWVGVIHYLYIQYITQRWASKHLCSNMAEPAGLL